MYLPFITGRYYQGRYTYLSLLVDTIRVYILTFHYR